ncbi:MAG: Ig-like domain-containing protein, partial [Vicinamibacteria bacterium]
MSRGGEQANGSSHNASMSADGRYVAFESQARNLVAGDTNGRSDIFVHDRESGETTRVSVSGDGMQADRDSTDPSMSGDGRFVTFASEARNLVTGDTNREQDVFTHDRQTGKTMRVSVSSRGTEGDDDSHHPSISGDGRYVAFASEARNLVAGDMNRRLDIFIHDRETGETTRVSVSSAGAEGNGDSEAPAISADGGFIAFASRSGNLVPDDTNGNVDVFVHDRQTGETTRVSLGSNGGQANGDSSAPSISSSGRFVTFESVASRLVDGDDDETKDVFVRDRGLGLTVRMSGGQERPSPAEERSRDDDSDDADDESDDDSDHDSDDDDSEEREEAGSDRPFINGSGSFVAFRSSASNLVGDDTNGRNDIFRSPVTDLNRPPEAGDDETITPQGTAVDIDVLANDTDPDGDDLLLRDFTSPANGTVTRNPDGTLRYAANQDFNGPDEFEYSVEDGNGGTDRATVRITVEPVTPPGPQAEDDEASTVLGASVDIDVLSNDTGAGLSVTQVTDPPHGTAVINPDHTVTYTPDAGFVGSDTFDYTATDTNGLTDTGTVNITVAPLSNNPPTARNDQTSTFEDVPVAIDVLANDTDPDGEPLMLVAVTAALNGTAIIGNNGVVYTPNPGFDGLDHFTYAVTDPRGATASASVRVNVRADAIPPVITGVVEPPANALGWNRTDVTVTFDCQDAESGIESCSDAVVVTSEGADQKITGTVVDRAGNTATRTLTVNLDKGAPTISLSGLSTARPGQSVTVAAEVSDAFPLDFVRFSVDGAVVPDKKSPPFRHTFSVPTASAGGTEITVEALVADRAGNVGSAPFSIRVQGGGFVQGEVYDDRRGVPLAGATVTLDAETVLSDARGRFGIFTDSGSGVLRIERDG